MLTARQMMPSIGQVVGVHCESLVVACTVLDARSRFGTADVQVQPLNGTGTPELDRWRDSMALTGFGKGGRALIVNEAHALRQNILRPLLGVLERLPSHCVVVFTTTTDGQEMLLDGIDGGPLLSRCLRV